MTSVDPEETGNDERSGFLEGFTARRLPNPR